MKRKTESSSETEKKAKAERKELIETTFYPNDFSLLYKTAIKKCTTFRKVFVSDGVVLIASVLMDILTTTGGFQFDFSRFSQAEEHDPTDIIIPYPEITKEIFMDYVSDVFTDPWSKRTIAEAVLHDVLSQFYFFIPERILGSLGWLAITVRDNETNRNARLKFLIETFVVPHFERMIRVYSKMRKPFTEDTLSFLRQQVHPSEQKSLAQIIYSLKFDSVEVTDSIQPQLGDPSDIHDVNLYKWNFESESVEPLEAFMLENYDFNIREAHGILAGGFVSAFFNYTMNTDRMKEVTDIDIFCPPNAWFYVLKWMDAHKQEIVIENTHEKPFHVKYRDMALSLNFVPTKDVTPEALIDNFDLPAVRIFYHEGKLGYTADFLYAAQTGRMVLDGKNTNEGRFTKYFSRGFVRLWQCGFGDKKYTYEFTVETGEFYTMLNTIEIPNKTLDFTEEKSSVPFESIF